MRAIQCNNNAINIFFVELIMSKEPLGSPQPNPPTTASTPTPSGSATFTATSGASSSADRSNLSGGPSQITVGLEIEKYAITPSLSTRSNKTLSNNYHKLLDNTKKARIIKDLGIEQYFPDQANQTSHLCSIQIKDTESASPSYKPFMEVIFDDNSNMGQLEFVSVGKGILPYNQFISPKNLNNVKLATEQFHDVVKQHQKALAAPAPTPTREVLEESLESSVSPSAPSSPPTTVLETKNVNQEREYVPQSREAAHLKFVFPQNTDPIWRSSTLNSSEGTVHVTHTVPLDAKRTEQKDFIKETYPNGRNPFRSDFLTLVPKGGTAGGTLHTGTRTNYAPNPKTPTEFLLGPSNDPYIRDVRSNEALFPMSNIAEYVDKDLKAYKEVREGIIQKLQDPTNLAHGEEQQLLTSLKKLDRTIIHLQTRLHETLQEKSSGRVDKEATIAALNVAQSELKSSNLAEYNNGYKKLVSTLPYTVNDNTNRLMFNSTEEKLMPPIGNSYLVEHRDPNDKLVKLCKSEIMGKAPKQAIIETSKKEKKETNSELRSVSNAFRIIDVGPRSFKTKSISASATPNPSLSPTYAASSSSSNSQSTIRRVPSSSPSGSASTTASVASSSSSSPSAKGTRSLDVREEAALIGLSVRPFSVRTDHNVSSRTPVAPSTGISSPQQKEKNTEKVIS